MKIVNSSVIFKTKYLLDLNIILNLFPNSYRDAKRFAAAIVKLDKCTALVFRTGNIVLIGNKSVSEAKRSAKLFICKLKENGIKAKLSGFKVKNLVGAGKLPKLLSIVIY